ncbi:SAM-dependent methyltransferase [Streptosporangium sp. NPDC004379]|uniref:SAM-dependent methyltransferase n=1 Tax=Streptosporangium sp. NPDC004379 TaxID=3366189 RepID=UPI0036C92AF7
MDAAAWDERYAAAELVWSAEPNRWVAQALDGRPPGTAVDLACGEGRNAVWLAERGWRVTGVDFSSVALGKAEAMAERRGAPVTWVHADATAWSPPEPVDLVVLAYFHLPAAERRRVHRTAAHALAPGGTLLVAGHDTTNLTRGVGGPQDPAVLFTPGDVLADVEGLGLETVRAEQLVRPVTGPGGIRDAIDAVVELRRPDPAGDVDAPA